jgi:hypothetical protein
MDTVTIRASNRPVNLDACLEGPMVPILADIRWTLHFRILTPKLVTSSHQPTIFTTDLMGRQYTLLDVIAAVLHLNLFQI